MRFWDTSALVPLLLEQPTTAESGAILSEDPEIAAWWGTAVECVSAVARLRREDRLTLDDEERALELLETLRQSWLEILPSEEVRAQAVRLLRVHGLKASDASVKPGRYRSSSSNGAARTRRGLVECSTEQHGTACLRRRNCQPPRVPITIQRDTGLLSSR